MARLSWIVHQCGVALVCVCVIGVTAQQSTTPSSSPIPALATDGDGGDETSSLAKGVQPLFEMTNVFLGKIVQPHRIGDRFSKFKQQIIRLIIASGLCSSLLKQQIKSINRL